MGIKLGVVQDPTFLLRSDRGKCMLSLGKATILLVRVKVSVLVNINMIVASTNWVAPLCSTFFFARHAFPHLSFPSTYDIWYPHFVDIWGKERQLALGLFENRSLEWESGLAYSKAQWFLSIMIRSCWKICRIRAKTAERKSLQVSEGSPSHSGLPTSKSVVSHKRKLSVSFSMYFKIWLHLTFCITHIFPARCFEYIIYFLNFILQNR